MTTTIDRRGVELLRGSTERRSFGAALEVRKSASGTHLTGYASTFGGDYEVQGFRERIVKGAFKNTLSKGADVVLLVGHEGIPLARTKSGTLKLSEDSRGLRVNAELDPKNPLVQNLLSPLRRGDLSEMSFAFRAVRDSWNEARSMRRVLEVDMNRADVSVVTHGANPETSLALRHRRAGVRRRTVVSSNLTTIKARRAKLRRGERPRRAFDVKSKYSPEAVQRYGEENPHRAFKKANGKYGWPILDGEDVSNAIDDYSAMNPSPPGVRAWIIKRARELRVEHRLPKGWGVVTPKPGPNASGQ